MVPGAGADWRGSSGLRLHMEMTAAAPQLAAALRQALRGSPGPVAAAAAAGTDGGSSGGSSSSGGGGGGGGGRESRSAGGLWFCTHFTQHMCKGHLLGEVTIRAWLSGCPSPPRLSAGSCLASPAFLGIFCLPFRPSLSFLFVIPFFYSFLYFSLIFLFVFLPFLLSSLTFLFSSFLLFFLYFFLLPPHTFFFLPFFPLYFFLPLSFRLAFSPFLLPFLLFFFIFSSVFSFSLSFPSPLIFFFFFFSPFPPSPPFLLFFISSFTLPCLLFTPGVSFSPQKSPSEASALSPRV